MDFETYSEIDLKKCGAWEYSKHPSTEILCFAYRMGTRETLSKSKIVTKGNQDLFQYLYDSNITIVAHNALFEQVIVRNVLGIKIPIERWICTAALARSAGLPGKLEDAGAALDLIHQKDKDGHRLMLKLSKPRKATKYNSETRHSNPDELEKLIEYCKQDVRTETELFLTLPPLAPIERKLWLLDQTMNLRGFAVDRELVKNAKDLIEEEIKRINGRVSNITNGEIRTARQTGLVLKALRDHGMNIPNLQAATISEAFKRHDFPNRFCKNLLKSRSAISRSSVTKYAAFEIRSRIDGRARDNTIFFGAHTGRQSGTGLQPQNLFKRVFDQKDVETGIDLIKHKDIHTIRALYKPLDLYASTLRSCIIAAPGKTLDVGDFATIEVRVLFWVAGDEDGLAALNSGRDLYIEMAAKIYGLKYAELREKYLSGDKVAFNMRQLGKQVVLGAGFGIGVGGEKFQATAKSYGMDISLELAKKAVKAYRELRPRIPAFWANIEKAAILAIRNPGKKYKIGYLIWEKKGKFLTCELPIGRKLFYFKPEITKKQTLWGERFELSYWGVNSVTRKFERTSTWGGKLTENVVQAIARDLLMESMLRLEANGYPPVLAVHDEIICEVPKTKNDLKVFLKLMETPPAWAKGLPVKVEGWSEERYRK